MSAKFITVEGIEGAGKTTCLKLIREVLERHRVPVLQTREPGGTPLAEEIREILLRPRAESVDAQAELLLMFAARAQHLHTLIEPALEAGTWVLCDRFTDATYAYQGGGRGQSMEDIGALEALVQKGRQPDLTLLLDVPPEIGLARARQRSAPDRFEQEKVAFYRRVRQAYLDRATAYPERYVVIDAEKPLEEVERAIRSALVQRLSLTGT
ncbi:MAG: dTMP kinase [Gammaproteobacteria bacterium]|nr:MAG: dTMP kinase [Gammaproteobacteria bacterium]